MTSASCNSPLKRIALCVSSCACEAGLSLVNSGMAPTSPAFGTRILWALLLLSVWITALVTRPAAVTALLLCPAVRISLPPIQTT